MKQAKLILDRDYVIGDIDPRIYGSFIEHIGRAVYDGIYEPGHPLADEEGFRTDVIDYIRRLDVPVTRYPGGNFVSGFNWEDSIGPKDRRPHRLDLAWFVTETNAFGLHEYCHWAKKANTEVMYAVNLGTRDSDAARTIVEYCNHPGGTYWSDLRRKNGEENPFGIKLWCLGNEMDGPWQMNAKTAYEYGRVANEAAKMMKWVDPTIELVACGSSSEGMKTFGSWEYEMLNECYQNVDYVSLHRYFNNRAADTKDFLASTLSLDEFIHTVESICDMVKGKLHSKKRLQLSLDEWNVWYHSDRDNEELLKRDKWGKALPYNEDIYNFEDALLVGLCLITILNHADRVKIACLAQLVNVIAPIMTRPGGGVWAQTIYWPFMHASRFGRGKSLRPVIESSKHDTKNYNDVPDVDCAATLSDDGTVTVFAVNRDLSEDVALNCDLRSFGGMRVVSHTVLHHDDLNAVNTETTPNHVIPYDIAPAEDAGEIVLPAASWNVIRLRAK